MGLSVCDHLKLCPVCTSALRSLTHTGCSAGLFVLYKNSACPGQKLIDSGLALTLASDYNPGSSPCSSMPFVVSLACIQMGLLPEEAFNAATINGAAAIEISDELGSIEIGKRANFIITKPVPSLNYLPYSFAESYIDRVVIA